MNDDTKALATALEAALDAIVSIMWWVDPFVHGDMDETMQRIHEERIDTALREVRAIVRKGGS